MTKSVPQYQVEQDRTRGEIIANLTHQVLQSSNKEKLMEELSLQDGQEPPIDERRDNHIIVEQRSIEAFELTDLTNKIQREIGHRYTSVGDTCLVVVVVAFFQVPAKKFFFFSPNISF